VFKSYTNRVYGMGTRIESHGRMTEYYRGRRRNDIIGVFFFSREAHAEEKIADRVNYRLNITIICAHNVCNIVLAPHIR